MKILDTAAEHSMSEIMCGTNALRICSNIVPVQVFVLFYLFAFQIIDHSLIFSNNLCKICKYIHLYTEMHLRWFTHVTHCDLTAVW